MPSKSAKQHRFMEAVAHNPSFAKKAGVPTSVGKHFHEADKMKRKKFDMGGLTDDPANQKYLNAREAAVKSIAEAQDAANDQYTSNSGFGMFFPTERKAVNDTMKAANKKQIDAVNLAKYLATRRNITEHKKGGHVKHANKMHGEAKETKAIAHEEMKALKRGHAPKKIMEHEKAEHKAMGYKHGGRIAPHPAKVTKAETKQKSYAMAESSGGRKTPHSKKQGLEGDTHLKGFGMGKGLGHGRTVTRAATPKDEMPRKGFAMKHGGHVKHHTKHMAHGGHAGSRRPKVDPAALAAMMGAGAPPMGAPAPGPMSGGMGLPPGGGAPGMKHGGHVSHHTHHHYKSGGHVEKRHKMAGGGMPEKGLRSPVRLGVGPMRPRPTGVGMKHGGGVKNTEMTKMKGPQFVADRKGTEKMIGGGSDKSKHGDGRALRGHTRAKQVKMASGGHIGSHPHRRGDGAATKGHTRCKVV